MALEATHLRFAFDLKDHYQVKDLSRYLSGAVYPDSRYVTGIDRRLTHPDDWRNWQTESDDFKKGWFVHLLLDSLQYEVTRELLPEVFNGQSGQGGEVWIKHSAIKILLDLNDLRHFDVKSCIPALEYVENPNNESLEVLHDYNQIFINMYTHPEKIDIDCESDMWKSLGVNAELAELVRKQTKEYSLDSTVMEKVSRIYQETLKRALVF